MAQEGQKAGFWGLSHRGTFRRMSKINSLRRRVYYNLTDTREGAGMMACADPQAHLLEFEYFWQDETEGEEPVARFGL
jgi:hypothetical protein